MHAPSKGSANILCPDPSSSAGPYSAFLPDLLAPGVCRSALVLPSPLQQTPSMDWLDTYSDPSVKAASVVTNLWIAAFAITSALFALLGTCVLRGLPAPASAAAP